MADCYKVCSSSTHCGKISIFVQKFNFDEIYSNIEFEFSRQKWDYWELDFWTKMGILPQCASAPSADRRHSAFDFSFQATQVQVGENFCTMIVRNSQSFAYDHQLLGWRPNWLTHYYYYHYHFSSVTKWSLQNRLCCGW